RGAFDRVLGGILPGLGARPDQFDHLIDTVRHVLLPCAFILQDRSKNTAAILRPRLYLSTAAAPRPARNLHGQGPRRSGPTCAAAGRQRFPSGCTRSGGEASKRHGMLARRRPPSTAA